MQYRSPEETTIALQAGTLTLAHRIDPTGLREKDFALREQAVARYESTAPMYPLDALNAIGGRLLDFLTFVTNQPASITVMRVVFQVPIGTRSWPQTCDVVFRPLAIRGDSASVLGTLNVLFTREDAAVVGLSELIRRWFALAQPFGWVLELLFGIFRSQGQFLETRLLTYAQAAELLHRRHPEFPQTLEENERMREVVLDAMGNEEGKTWLVQKLQWAHEPSLRQRLGALLAFVGPEVEVLFPRKFINRAVNTRNYYTHYTQDLEAQAAKEADLLYLAEQLRVLVLACLMRELGFTSAAVASCVNRNPRLKHLLNQGHTRPLLARPSRGPATSGHEGGE